MKKILLILVLISFRSVAQTGCPLYSGINAWNTCINTTLINGANGGGTKLQVAMWLDTIAKYALLNSSSVTSFNTRIGAITLTSGDVTTALTYTPVTNARTLTINGVTYDLSANRSWSISTLTSPLTTKGDIWVYGTGDTRLPVGTDGQVLTAASGSLRGVQWSTPTSGTVTSVSGTTNRITVASGTTTPVIDIAATYVGQSSITTLGTIGTGTWQGTSISTTYTDAKIKTVTGTSNRITIGGTSTDPTFDISTSYVGQNTITTLGTITTGTWNGTALTSAYVGSLTGGQVGISGLSATGTPSSSTYLRGDNTWATVTGGTVTSIATTSGISGGTITSTGTLTNDLITGISGGQTVIGGTGATDLLKWKTTSGNQTSGNAYLWLGGNNGATTLLAMSFDGNLTPKDGATFILGTSTGTKFGTSTSQKLAFYNSTPIVQPTGNLVTALSNLGLVASGTITTSNVTDFFTSTGTFTNKRITERIDAQTSSSSYTPNIDNYDGTTFSALAAAITINAPTGTPTDGQPYWIRFKDNSTARGITWNSIFRAGDAALPSTTVLGKNLYCGFRYNATDTKYDLVALINNF